MKPFHQFLSEQLEQRVEEIALSLNKDDGLQIIAERLLSLTNQIRLLLPEDGRDLFLEYEAIHHAIRAYIEPVFYRRGFTDGLEAAKLNSDDFK